MAEGFICDRCGKPIQARNRSTFEVELTSPVGNTVQTLGKKDICPDCYGPVKNTLETRVSIEASAEDFIVEVSERRPRGFDTPAGDPAEGAEHGSTDE